MSLWKTHKLEHSTNMKDGCKYCNDLLNPVVAQAIFTTSETAEGGNRKTRRERNIFLNKLAKQGLIKYVGKEAAAQTIDAETILENLEVLNGDAPKP